jgi:hypothetical protein
MMMLEKNNLAISKVIADWLDKQISRPSSIRRRQFAAWTLYALMFIC